MSITQKGMSILELYRLYRNKKLLMNRRYQRKLVWTKEEKASLIESILFNYPIPLILGKDVEIIIKNTSSISGKVTVTDTKSTFVAS